MALLRDPARRAAPGRRRPRARPRTLHGRAERRGISRHLPGARLALPRSRRVVLDDTGEPLPFAVPAEAHVPGRWTDSRLVAGGLGVAGVAGVAGIAGVAGVAGLGGGAAGRPQWAFGAPVRATTPGRATASVPVTTPASAPAPGSAQGSPSDPAQDPATAALPAATAATASASASALASDPVRATERSPGTAAEEPVPAGEGAR